MKTLFKTGASAIAAALSFIMTVSAASLMLDGQVSSSSKEIYPGVLATEYYSRAKQAT